MLSSVPRVQAPRPPNDSTRTRDVRRQTTLWETSDIHFHHRMGHQLSWAELAWVRFITHGATVHLTRQSSTPPCCNLLHLLHLLH